MSHMWLNLPGLPPLFLQTLSDQKLRMRQLVVWTQPLWAQGFTVLLVYHLLEPVRLEPACQILERWEVAASDVANCNVVTSLVGRALQSEYHPTSAIGSAESFVCSWLWSSYRKANHFIEAAQLLTKVCAALTMLPQCVQFPSHYSSPLRLQRQLPHSQSALRKLRKYTSLLPYW